MARQFVNPFTPRSDIGQGVSNILTALFAGAGSGANAGNAALSEQRLASAAYDEARKNEILDRMIGVRDLSENIGKAYRGAQATRTPELALNLAQGDDGLGLQVDEEMIRNLISEAATPVERGMTYNERLAARPGPQIFKYGDEPAMSMMSGDETMLTAPSLQTPAALPVSSGASLRLPREQQFPDIEVGQGPLGPVSPEAAFMMNAQVLEALARASGTVTSQGLAEAMGKLQAQEAERALLAGEISPTQYFQLLGKQVTDIKGDMQFNRADPTQPLTVTPPGQAQIDLRGAQQALADERRQWVGPLAESLIESRKRGTPMLNINIGQDGTVDVSQVPAVVEEDTRAVLGFGGTGFIGKLLNKIPGMYGGQLWFPNVKQAEEAINYLNNTTTLDLSVDVPGRISNQVREIIRVLAEAKPSSIFVGDEEARIKIQMVRNWIEKEVERMQTAILDRPDLYAKNPKDYLTTRNNHSRLVLLLREYDTLLNNFGATDWSGGFTGGPMNRQIESAVGAEWTEAQERDLQEKKKRLEELRSGKR